MWSVVGVLLVALLALATLPCGAIHADEQGLRDWVRRFVGDVQYAAVAPEARPSLLYVASREGAVAALAVRDKAAEVNLTWRELLSETPRCLAASTQGVLVATAEGSVHVFNPDTGFLDVTYALVLPTATVTQMACSCTDTTAHIVVYANDTVHLYTLDLDSDEERVTQTRTWTVGVGVRSVHVTPSALWIGNAAGAVVEYALEDGAERRTVPGIAVGVGSADELVTVTAETGRCVECGAVAVRRPGTGAGAELVTVTSSTNASTVTFASGVTRTIAREGDEAAATPLLAFGDGDDTLVLLQTPTRDLRLVSARDGLVWERPEGVTGAVAALIIDPPVGTVDHLHFNKLALLVSRDGVLYAIPLARMGREVRRVMDVAAATRRRRPDLDQAIAGLQVQSLTLAPGTTKVVRVRARIAHTTALIDVDLTTTTVVDVTLLEDALVVGTDVALGEQLAVRSTRPASNATTSLRRGTFFYVAHAQEGVVRGYYTHNVSAATPTWTLRLPYPIIAHASGAAMPGRTAVVNGLHIYPNTTEEEPVQVVRQRYPMRNVVALAYYEPMNEQLPTLVVVAVDAVTGNVLATTRHANVEGAVHMLIAEHSILYYFLDAYKMRYCFGVWELFEASSQRVTKGDGATLPQIIASFFVHRARAFSSRATQPPTVAVSVLGAYGGPLADMSLTTSSSAIARKSVVLAYETGRVAIVELRQLLAGGQMPLPRHKDRLASHVIIPSTHLATHRQRLALPRFITTEPTALESSCHVLVAGLDLFYVRSSSGKPFDVLNSDFNKPLLITLFCVFAALSLIVRYFVNRKGLYVLWN